LTTNPLNVYGQSKLAGEEAIRENCDRHLILRTSWFMAATAKVTCQNHRLGAEREEIRVVADQIGSPTWTGDMPAAGLIPQLKYPDKSGTYHYTNSGVASWYDCLLLSLKKLAPWASPQSPTRHSHYYRRLSHPAKRPAYSVLDCENICGSRNSCPTGDTHLGKCWQNLKPILYENSLRR